MPRPVKDSKLDSRTARARLKPSAKPYYRGLDHGLHIGYRKGARAGRWVARFYLGEQQYEVETIGTADDFAEADGVAVLDWRQAQDAARKRAAERAKAAAGIEDETAALTVQVAVEAYLTWLEVHRKSAADARYRAEAHIFPALGDLDVARLTTAKLRTWHQDLAEASARVRTRKGKDQKHKPEPAGNEAIRRRRASANRVLTILKAALNQAWRDGKVTSDAEWRRVEPYEGVDAARVRYLTLEECKRLSNAASPEFRPLLQGALLSGCRYGELRRLDCRDYNPDSGTAAVRLSKSGKARHVILTAEGQAFFAALVAGRPGNAPLFRKLDGTRWGASHQARPMADACAAGKIEPPATFHTLRHTYASHAIMNGVPLLVVARNLGHSDTRMVEKHYGHLAPSYEAEAIRKGAPVYGIAAESNVVALEVVA
jgi:integrase